MAAKRLRNAGLARSFGIVAAILLAANLGAMCGAPVETTDVILDPEPTSTNDAEPNAVEDGVVVGNLIVEVRPGADDAALDALYTENNVSVRDRIEALSLDLLNVDPDERETVRDALADDPLIEAVDENQVYDVGDRPEASEAPPWYLEAVRAAALDDELRGASAVIVAIVDTGVDTDHPLLAAELLSGGNTVDGVAGWEDTVGHGTAVAGIVSAVANGWFDATDRRRAVRLLPIRATGADGRASDWSLAAAISLAVDRGAHVINVSFDPLDSSVVMRQAELASNRGALVVFASGNQGQRKDDPAQDAAVFVGSVGSKLDRSAFSSFGPFLTLVAPGEQIESADLDGDRATWSGTSFAAPIATGVAALVRGANPDLRPPAVAAILELTAEDLGAPLELGAGLVDAQAALELAAVFEQPTDNSPPTVTLTAPTNELAGEIVLAAAIDDESPILEATLRIDGAAIGADRVAPFRFIVNTAALSKGVHELELVASDVYGNTGSDTIEITVGAQQDKTPPTVEIESPVAGSLVSGVITILARVTDETRVSRAAIYVDGNLLDEIDVNADEALLAQTWNVGDVRGERRIEVRVFDLAGNKTTASIAVLH